MQLGRPSGARCSLVLAENRLAVIGVPLDPPPAAPPPPTWGDSGSH